jgi:hypothetical protein
MISLLTQGYKVVAVELSVLAIEAFFNENAMAYTVQDTQIPKKVNLLPLHLPKKEARLSVIAGNLVSTTIPDSHLIL